MTSKQKSKSTVRKSTPQHTQTKALTARDVLIEADSTYFFKLVVYVILGTLWLKFQSPLIWSGLTFNAIPAGMLVGVLAVKLVEKNQLDRKIWYAVLVLVGVISYFVPAGIVI